MGIELLQRFELLQTKALYKYLLLFLLSSIFSYRIMLECWRSKPRNRPTIKQLESMLCTYLYSLQMCKSLRELYPNSYDYWEENLFMNDEDEYSEDEYI